MKKIAPLVHSIAIERGGRHKDQSKFSTLVENIKELDSTINDFCEKNGLVRGALTIQDHFLDNYIVRVLTYNPKK